MAVENPDSVSVRPEYAIGRGTVSDRWRGFNLRESNTIGCPVNAQPPRVGPKTQFSGCSDVRLGYSPVGEFIANAGHSDYQCWMLGILLQFVAQASYMHIDCARERAAVIAPDRA
jgi:hypothetical protein